jgi:hypothetical protein
VCWSRGVGLIRSLRKFGWNGGAYSIKARVPKAFSGWWF